jgi:hypothetical protein
MTVARCLQFRFPMWSRTRIRQFGIGRWYRFDLIEPGPILELLNEIELRSSGAEVVRTP